MNYLWLTLIWLFQVTYTVFGIPIDNSLVLRVQNRNPVVLATELVCSGATADLMFIIDGSTSIGDENFNLVRNFLSRVVSKLPTTSRVATIQFSGTPRTEFSFNTFRSTVQAAVVLKQLPYKRGTTKVGLAIRHALEKELLPERGDRPDVINIIIVITDGRSEDDPDAPARELRAKGNTVLVVGVTDLIAREQLLAIAGAPQNVFEVEDFTKLDEDLEGQILSNQACDVVQITEIPSGEPSLDIECGSDSFYVAADTRNPFEGQVYAKNHYNDPNCVKTFDGTANVADIEIPFSECGTTRRRSLSPPGIYIENTITFKFHPQMLTKIDQTFKVQCFYMESDKTVKNEFGPVQELMTGLSEGQFEMPVCEYSVRKGSPEGEAVQFALVGDMVFHRWQCDDTDSQGLFKMTVYDCYVDDGAGNRLQIIDENGCSIDKYLLGNLDYDTDRLLVTKEAHVFKFADKPQVFFQCQINLCVNLPDYDGELACQDTPPNCTLPEVSNSASFSNINSRNGRNNNIGSIRSNNIGSGRNSNTGSNRNRNAGNSRSNSNLRSGRNGVRPFSNNGNPGFQFGRRRVGRSVDEVEFEKDKSLDVMTDHITVLDNVNDMDFVHFYERWLHDKNSTSAGYDVSRQECMALAQMYVIIMVSSCLLVILTSIFIVQYFTSAYMNRLRFDD